MITKIEQSKVSAIDKKKALEYIEFCNEIRVTPRKEFNWDWKSPYGGMIPPGVVEFFKIALNDVSDEALKFSRQIEAKFVNLQFTGGSYEDVYFNLQKLTENEFTVDNFRLIIDGDANPYLGYVNFVHKEEKWYYAPDTFEAPFGSLIFKYLNYFLSETGLSAKRFCSICFTSILCNGSADDVGVFFITNEQFVILNEYNFIRKHVIEDLFWTKREGIQFNSVLKE